MMYRSRPEICPSSAHACSNHAVTCPEHLNIQFELLYAFLYTESRLLIVLLSFYGFARIPSKPESVRFPSRRSSVAPAGTAGPGERPCAPVCARANRRGPRKETRATAFPRTSSHGVHERVWGAWMLARANPRADRAGEKPVGQTPGQPAPPSRQGGPQAAPQGGEVGPAFAQL